MLLRLRNASVSGYAQGQAPLVYLVSDVPTVVQSGGAFVFTDGHSLAAETRWFDDQRSLGEIDWTAVFSRYWADTPEDRDRQRRKQAEFLVYRVLPWELVREIAVVDPVAAEKVGAILRRHPGAHHPAVNIRRGWYYP